MAYVNFVKSKTLAQALTDSQTNPNKIYFPTDGTSIIMENKEYGKQPTLLSQLTNDSGFVTSSGSVSFATSASKDGNGNIISDTYELKSAETSRGNQLVTNGSGVMGNNYNFSTFTFDGAVANFSPGSFTRPIGTSSSPSVDEYISVNTNEPLYLTMDLKSLNGLATGYGCLMMYDADKYSINASNIMYRPNTLTSLSRELKNGDTVVYLTDVTNWDDTLSYGYRRGFIFWNYKNSFGYEYPENTYSRNVFQNKFENNSINTSTNTITLSAAWTGGTIPVGTKVSQCDDGGTYSYWGIVGSAIPNTWTTYSATYSGVDTSGRRESRKFVPGTAYVRLGWIWNYNRSDDQIWVTNINAYPLRKASTSSAADTATLASAITTIAGTDNSYRDVFFALNGDKTKVVYDDDFQYNPSINTLKIGSGTLTATNYSGTAAKASEVAWSGVTGKPTTISGYGITDAQAKLTDTDNSYGQRVKALEDSAVKYTTQSLTAAQKLQARKNIGAVTKTECDSSYVSLKAQDYQVIQSEKSLHEGFTIGVGTQTYTYPAGETEYGFRIAPVRALNYIAVQNSDETEEDAYQITSEKRISNGKTYYKAISDYQTFGIDEIWVKFENYDVQIYIKNNDDTFTQDSRFDGSPYKIYRAYFGVDDIDLNGTKWSDILKQEKTAVRYSQQNFNEGYKQKARSNIRAASRKKTIVVAGCIPLMTWNPECIYVAKDSGWVNCKIPVKYFNDSYTIIVPYNLYQYTDSTIIAKWNFSNGRIDEETLDEIISHFDEGDLRTYDWLAGRVEFYASVSEYNFGRTQITIPREMADYFSTVGGNITFVLPNGDYNAWRLTGNGNTLLNIPIINETNVSKPHFSVSEGKIVYLRQLNKISIPYNPEVGSNMRGLHDYLCRTYGFNTEIYTKRHRKRDYEDSIARTRLKILNKYERRRSWSADSSIGRILKLKMYALSYRHKFKSTIGVELFKNWIK